jgi:D-xylose transport system substrate-binding protein
MEGPMKHIIDNNVLCVKNILCVALVVIFFSFFSCKKDEEPQDTESPPLIGFLMDSLIEERWSRDRDIFLSRANFRGAEVIIQFSEGDSELQAKQLDYLLDQQVDVLVIVASDSFSLAEPIQDAKKAGVPVMLYERLVSNSGADLYLAYDGLSAGMQQAEALLNNIENGSIVIYNGLANDIYAEEVHEGIMQVLAEPIKNGNITIIDDYWPQNIIDNEEAFQYMSAILQENPDISGIITINDLQAEAIIRALAVNRLTGTSIVIGADADIAACQRIVEGSQYMTIYKPIEFIASTAADLAVNMAKKESFTIHNAINDGTFRVPYYKLPPVAVDISNINETVIKDGFHLKEDVYRNVFP